MLVDSHCHLNMKEFHEDLDTVIQNAIKAGVKYMQTICVKLEDLPGIIAIAEKYPNVFASVGVHPHDADEATPQHHDDLAQTLIDLSAHPKIIGIGETGLDYYYEHSDRTSQKEAFRAHINASQETQLPLIIHTRAADDDTLDIIKSEMRSKTFPALIHCFSSSERLALECVDMGLYISLSGIITFKTAESIREAASKVPIERLLVETDSPYLAPIPMRGKRCEPSYTRHVAEKLAEIKDLSIKEVEDKTTENFFRLFTKAVA